ncbi:hypothetical protein EGW08_001852, partial [Elysia chlorotica]
ERALEDEVGEVGLEDEDEGQVHVEGLHSHPAQGGKQGVVQEHGHHLAGGAVAEAVVVHARQVDQVREQQRRAQVHQDLGRVVSPQLPGGVWGFQKSFLGQSHNTDTDFTIRNRIRPIYLP